jgi:predicted DNA-binding transcriptional regulator AlpA
MTNAPDARNGGRLLTATDVAQYLQIAPKKVYELSIPMVRISERRVRYLESDMLAYVQRNRNRK